MQIKLIFTRRLCTWPHFEREGFGGSEVACLKNGANDVVRPRSPRYFLSDRCDHMETINRDDHWNYFSAIAEIATIVVAISAIVAIIWKPGLSDVSLDGRFPEVGFLSGGLITKLIGNKVCLI